ncbi:MAG: NYN domain-containing protein [Gemmatimonadota bacterium]|nr:NYN domain-containing protein [Gemmatimonadota bacterium]
MTFRTPRTAPTSPRRPVAPIHRGPQAVSQPAVGSHTIHHAPNAALLIDFDNVTMGIRSDLQTELKNLLASDIIKGKVSVQRAYADWRRYPQYIVPLAESSIDMIMAPAYGSAKKNATDIRLAIDALELVFVRPEIGTFILLSGDSDFSSLVIKLKEYGKYVIGVGIRESSSDLLVMNCDEYYSYNSLAGLVKSGDEEVVKLDPWELVTEAVQRMKRNGDVMRADRLKQVMQQMDSSFDEKNVGKSKFSLFVAEAAKKGLLSLTKLENGQYEVDLPHSGGGLPPGQSAPVAEVSENGEPRRPRRSGRGRDRVPRGAARPERAATDDQPAQDAAAAPGAKVPEVATPSARAAPAVQAQARAASRASAAAEIGSTGLRLTREEAFNLVRRAVESLVSGDAAAAASLVRSTARALLGRDSESLSERNFTRILQDAHDADVVDLRRRGNDYEVAASAGAPAVAAQLAAAESANTPAPPPTVAAPRGMSTRGGRGPMGRPGAPPANILNVGVVGTRSVVTAATAAPASAATSQTEAPAATTESAASASSDKAAATGKKPVRGRKRASPTKKTVAGRKDVSAEASDSGATAAPPEAPGATARKRATRGGRKKATSIAGSATRTGSEPE